jgi:NAD(P) transhydrogenase
MWLKFDLLVIGAGPGGWSAALQGAKLGLEVGVVEKGLMLGGACVRTGTLPSKALRHTVLKLVNSRRSSQLGVAASELIHIGMMLLHTGSTLDHILSAVFNYPTLSEAYRIAALDGVNRL